MSRTTGATSKERREYVQCYETLVHKYKDPLEVLFVLLGSRKQTIRLQAAKELVSYRYPKQAVAKLEVESSGQLVMAWEETLDLPPKEPINITPQVEVINDR